MVSKPESIWGKLSKTRLKSAVLEICFIVKFKRERIISEISTNSAANSTRIRKWHNYLTKLSLEHSFLHINPKPTNDLSSETREILYARMLPNLSNTMLNSWRHKFITSWSSSWWRNYSKQDLELSSWKLSRTIYSFLQNKLISLISPFLSKYGNPDVFFYSILISF